MKFGIFTILLVFIFLYATGCKKTIASKKTVENNIIGTWKYEKPDKSFWFQMIFNKDLSGNRTDSDGENNNFIYSIISEDEVNFTSGFPNGKYNYYLLGSDKLILFGDTLIRK